MFQKCVGTSGDRPRPMGQPFFSSFLQQNRFKLFFGTHSISNIIGTYWRGWGGGWGWGREGNGVGDEVWGGGGTCDIAEPVYKTFNLHTRLSTYIQDFQLTYKNFSLPTRHKPDHKLDFQLTYKTLN